MNQIAKKSDEIALGEDESSDTLLSKWHTQGSHAPGTIQVDLLSLLLPSFVLDRFDINKAIDFYCFCF